MEEARSVEHGAASGWRRWAKRIGWAALALLCAAVAVGLALALTAAGRALIAHQVERRVSDRIAGSLEIGELRSIGLLHPVATDVVFRDVDGTRVLSVERASVDIDLWAALRGRLAFDGAEAHGVSVLVDVPEQGVPNIKRAFQVDRSGEDPDDLLKLDLRDMRFDGAALWLRAKGETKVVMHDLSGFIRVYREDTHGVQVTLSQVRGHFVEPKLPNHTIELEDLDGWIHAKTDHVVHMEMSTKIGAGGLDVVVDYHKDHEPPVELRLHPKAGGGAIMTAVGTAVRSWFTDKLSVDLVSGDDD
ncbi:MAG: hypothetical protein KC543_05210 [Myxococcales bacterium]|nr:hypothetical protein [Myxococcales bacterium]